MCMRDDFYRCHKPHQSQKMRREKAQSTPKYKYYKESFTFIFSLQMYFRSSCAGKLMFIPKFEIFNFTRCKEFWRVIVTSPKRLFSKPYDVYIFFFGPGNSVLTLHVANECSMILYFMSNKNTRKRTYT